MKAMLEEGYFVGEKNVFLPGDSLRVVQVKDPNIHSRGNKVVAFVDLLVTEITKNGPKFYGTDSVNEIVKPRVAQNG